MVQRRTLPGWYVDSGKGGRRDWVGIFDEFGDILQKVGDTMQKTDPFGPEGLAGEMMSNIVTVAEAVDSNGPEALSNFAAEAADIASAAEFFLPKAKQTPIIAAGLKTVMGMQVLCGWTNPPERGDGYDKGYQLFNEAIETLKAAAPEPSWTGPASDAYATANAEQLERARMMVDADIDVSNALSAEAGTVENTRRILNNAATMMGNAIIPAVAAKAIPRVGRVISLEIEMSVVGVSLPTCRWYLNELRDASSRAAETVNNATLVYEAVTRGCYPVNM